MYNVLKKLFFLAVRDENKDDDSDDDNKENEVHVIYM